MSEASVQQGRASGSLWVYAGLALVATAGFFYVNIMAAIVDGLIAGLGFSNAQAGAVGAANIYGASVGSFIAVLLVRRVQWRPTLFALLSVLLVLDLGSMLLRDPGVMVPVRALHGVVGGLAVGVTYSVIARTRSPDRAFGMLLLVQFGLGGLGVMFLPTLVPQFGTRVLFLSLAAVSVCALAILALLPKLHSGTTPMQGGGGVATTGAGAWHPAWIVLLALFLFQAGNMALSAFIIRLGGHFLLDRAFIGQALGWATWIGALGAVLVIVMGTKYGRVRPLLLSTVLTLAGTAAFWRSDLAWVFFAANVGTAITWSFVVPYLFGMLSRLDASGRMATAGGFASKLGLASGPLLAGFVLSNDDFNLLVLVALALLVLATVTTLVAARYVDRLEPNP